MNKLVLYNRIFKSDHHFIQILDELYRQHGLESTLNVLQDVGLELKDIFDRKLFDNESEYWGKLKEVYIGISHICRKGRLNLKNINLSMIKIDINHDTATIEEIGGKITSYECLADPMCEHCGKYNRKTLSSTQIEEILVKMPMCKDDGRLTCRLSVLVNYERN